MFGGDMMNMYNQVVDDLKKTYNEIETLKQELQRKDNIINELKEWLEFELLYNKNNDINARYILETGLDKIKELENGNK